MKTQQYVLPLLALLAASASAAPRTPQQARAIAQEALSHYTNTEVSLTELPQRATQRGSEADVNQFTPYYIFNDAQQHGFILVSGSDLMPEVLGYGLDGSLTADPEQLPDNLRSWLQYVADVEAYVEQHPESAPLMQSAQNTSVSPISRLLTTEWGQDAPFCDQCPMKNGQRTITGCMATSISQAINYFEYPSQFEGSYSYKDMSVTRSLDFSEVSIDYSLLANRYYRANTTDEEKAEVAKLMYSVGIAINMNYGLSSEGGSGAITEMGIRGLRENLGHKQAQHLLRRYFSLDEWNKIIQEELRAGRPVVMGGHSSEGGHSFVCDGMDSRGFYHINWGWEGLADSYFDVSILHPDTYGAGATEASDGFTGSQDIMIHLGDPTQDFTWYSPLFVDSDASIRCNKQTTTLGNDVALTARVHNTLPSSFKGYAGILVMKDGQEYAREEGASFSVDATRLISNTRGNFYYDSYGSISLTRSYTLPTDMPEGEYEIYLYVRDENSEQIDIIRQSQASPSCYTATVTGHDVSLSCQKPLVPFAAEAWSVDQNPATTRPTTFSVDLSNYSKNSVASILYAQFIRPNGTKLKKIEGPVLTIAPGEQATAEFEVEFDQVGEWTVQIIGQPVGIDVYNSTEVCSKQFYVSLDNTYGARFSISKKLEVVNEKLYNVGPAEFSVGLANEGSEYHGKVAVRIYSNKTSIADKYLQAEIINDLDFAAQTTDNVTISGDLDLSKLTVDKATLYARVFYLRGDDMEQITSSSTTITVYRKEDAAIKAVTVDQPDPLDFSNAEVYDICGRRINVTGRLPRGIYIVNGQKKIVK